MTASPPTSGMDEVLVDITAFPAAIASNTGKPKPS